MGRMTEEEAYELAEKLARVIVYAVAALIAALAFAGLTWLACWGLGIAWSWRVAVGVAAAVAIIRVANAHR